LPPTSTNTTPKASLKTPSPRASSTMRQDRGTRTVPSNPGAFATRTVIAVRSPRTCHARPKGHSKPACKARTEMGTCSRWPDGGSLGNSVSAPLLPLSVY
jgi:hypothetical protein